MIPAKPVRAFLLSRLLPCSLVVFCSVVVASPIFAATEKPKQPFDEWLLDVRTEAIGKGYKPSVVDAALAGVKPVRRIIERDRNQSEFKLTLDRYSKRVVTKKNIERGRARLAQHRDLLDQITAKYGVQPRFILAIWGIETRFGLVKATMPVVPAVATLAYDRRRSKYFRAQIMAVLEMLDKGYIDLDSLRGSWAGAMGQPQFMPTSYLAYAVDFDGDGRRDIWNNIGDVLASIANYLAAHGWKPDQTWGRQVTAPQSLKDSLLPFKRRAAPGCRARTSEIRNLSAWQAAGVRRADGTDLPSRDLPAAMVLPDGRNGTSWLVYRNYRSIMAYNCAHLYAVTVGMLSDRIGR